MICRVGVTGHRPERLRANNADLTILRQRVAEVLRAIAVAVEDTRRHAARTTPYVICHPCCACIATRRGK